MRRSDAFLMLVQTEAIVFDIKGEHEGSMAVTILFHAMQIDPTCLPKDLAQATWEFINHILMDSPPPSWLRYAANTPRAAQESTAGGKIEGDNDDKP